MGEAFRKLAEKLAEEQRRISMTRGRILFIDSNQELYSSIEFNGDMYPEGNGAEVIEKFEAGSFTSFSRYSEFVKRFNEKHYKYPEDIIESAGLNNERVIDISENWTDYLYIINNSEECWIINEENGKTLLDKRCLAIVNYQKVDKIIHRVIHEEAKPVTYDLSKKEFIEIIDRLRESHDLVQRVNELFRESRENVEADFCNGASLQISHESVVVELLEKLMHDVTDDISYFIYELDYGRKYKPGYITYADGQEIDFRTAEKLYDYLRG